MGPIASLLFWLTKPVVPFNYHSFQHAVCSSLPLNVISSDMDPGESCYYVLLAAPLHLIPNDSLSHLYFNPGTQKRGKEAAFLA